MAVLLAGAAFAGEPVFADQPLDSIHLVSVQQHGAIVEGKGGELTLVDVGDTLGSEKAEVKRVSGSCLSLLTRSGPVSLCADGPQVPVPNS